MSQARWEERWITEDNQAWSRQKTRRLPGMSDEAYDQARDRCAEPETAFQYDPERNQLNGRGGLDGTQGTLLLEPFEEVVEDDIHEMLRRR